jgi:hypothetical protein
MVICGPDDRTSHLHPMAGRFPRFRESIANRQGEKPALPDGG